MFLAIFYISALCKTSHKTGESLGEMTQMFRVLTAPDLCLISAGRNTWNCSRLFDIYFWFLGALEVISTSTDNAHIHN